MPLLASQERRTVASWTLYFSAIFLSSGSACKGESGHVSGLLASAVNELLAQEAC
jgi:cysteine sulfinate desulfinase/cysteine desulfurase-like protein